MPRVGLRKREPIKSAVPPAKRRKIYISDDESDEYSSDEDIIHTTINRKVFDDSDDEDTGTQECPIIINSSSSDEKENEDEYESDFIDNSEQDDEQINAYPELLKSVEPAQIDKKKFDIDHLINAMMGKIASLDTRDKLFNIIQNNIKYNLHQINKIYREKCCACNIKYHNVDHLFDGEYIGTFCVKRLRHLIEVAEYAYKYNQEKDKCSLKDLKDYHLEFQEYSITLGDIGEDITDNFYSAHNAGLIR